MYRTFIKLSAALVHDGVLYNRVFLPWRVQIRRWSVVVERSAGILDCAVEIPSRHRSVLGPDLQPRLPRVSSYPPYTPGDRSHSDSGCSGQLQRPGHQE